MKKRIFRFPFFIVIMIIFRSGLLSAQAVIDLETGIVGTGYNDVRIPGDQGTLFSMKNDLDPATKIFYRVRLNYTFNTRHTLSLLYSPLEIKSEGRVPGDISFEEVLFPANTKLEGTYKFNSYRLTYRYRILNTRKLDFGLGITAKIRDAKIVLSSDGLTDNKVNVGFVPLINFHILWSLNEKFGILIDGDALAAKQGRAEDVLVAGMYQLTDRIGFKAGYRILEGGADNDEVYNFALFHYASVGVIISL